MSHRELFPGQFLSFAFGSNSPHYFGGVNDCDGAWCINCEMPLMLHLTLDTSDPRAPLGTLPCRWLRLLYCMRCSLCWHDFSYRIVSDGAVEIVEAFKGETTWDDWYSDGGANCFSRRPVSLSPIPERLQDLYDRLNAGIDLSDEEEAEVAALTNNYADEDIGGYPIVDVINQLGGRSFLCQRLGDPPCPVCRGADSGRRRMYFLASLTNDPKNNVKMTYDDVQIVFFVCPECHTIKVQHSA